MISVYKTDSNIEKKLQQVESLLRGLNLTIEWNSDGLNIVEGAEDLRVRIMDTESRDATTTLPRMFESERLVIVEG